MYIPSASLPPGHFCIATELTLVAGHVMFHAKSCSKGHLLSSIQIVKLHKITLATCNFIYAVTYIYILHIYVVLLLNTVDLKKN